MVINLSKCTFMVPELEVLGHIINSDRQVCLTVTGVSNNDYSRTAEMVMNVPYSRMNETMRRVNNMGGKIVGVSVTGPTSDA